MNQSFDFMSTFLSTNEEYKNEDLAIEILLTKNKRLEKMDIKNFIYSIPDPSSSDYSITEEQQSIINDIITECKENIWFFFRELLYIGEEGFVRPFNLKLMELSVIYAFKKNRKILLQKRHNSVSSSMELFASLILYSSLFDEEHDENTVILDTGHSSEFKDYVLTNIFKSNRRMIRSLFGKYSDKKIEDVIDDYSVITTEHLTDEDIANAYMITCDDNSRKLLESNYTFILKQIANSKTPFLIKITEKNSVDGGVPFVDSKDRMLEEFKNSYNKIEVNTLADLFSHSEDELKNADYIFVQIPRKEHQTYQLFLKRASMIDTIPHIAGIPM